eukprot:scaffold1522_cov166-Amphora_coffeaeformis.AAC.3
MMKYDEDSLVLEVDFMDEVRKRKRMNGRGGERRDTFVAICQSHRGSGHRHRRFVGQYTDLALSRWLYFLRRNYASTTYIFSQPDGL